MKKPLHTWTSPDGSVRLEASSEATLAHMVRQVEETGSISYGQSDDAETNPAAYRSAFESFRKQLAPATGGSFPAGSDLTRDDRGRVVAFTTPKGQSARG